MARKDIGAAQANFTKGVEGAAAKWQERTSAAGNDYAAGFGQILAKQNSCGARARSTAKGYPALVAYANCMLGGSKA